MREERLTEFKQWHHPMNARARYNLLEIELLKWVFAKLSS
jgi:hypothetical protein